MSAIDDTSKLPLSSEKRYPLFEAPPELHAAMLEKLTRTTPARGYDMPLACYEVPTWMVEGVDLDALREEIREEGRQEGYPECCIAEYVHDLTVLRLAPAMLRGGHPNGHVPCSACRARGAA